LENDSFSSSDTNDEID